MTKITRRGVLKGSAGIAAAGALGLGAAPHVRAADLSFTPEPDAELRVLRWKRFVEGDEVVFMENTARFSEQTGVPVRVDNESWEDLRPKSAVAANVGKGPDIILGFNDDPHQFPDKLVDVSDLADYLGTKYGGWYDVCRIYGTQGDSWIALPMGGPTSCVVYRRSWLNEAGFETLPGDNDGFLAACRALAAKGHPPGFAFGHAVGDANAVCQWMLWSNGGMLVDENDQVVLDAPETLAALEYAKELYATLIPGTISWLDPHNNKAFLSEQISLTFNGISIYYAAKKSDDPKLQAIAKDIEHASLPVGPVGKPTQAALVTLAMIFGYSPYPNAAKEYVRFMMEEPQYVPWQEASIGYITQPLAAYESNPVWTEDPKHTPYRDTIKRALWDGYAGSPGYASAAAAADFILVDMFAEVVAGQRTPKEAAQRAQRRAERYYRRA
jgi:multiple sugar transport system substrate-binding protein